MAVHGRFIPRNPQKYIGNPNEIFFRSSWEIHAMKFLDSSNAVMKWGSEEIKIPYLKPVIDETTGKAYVKPANYYPDFIVVYQDKTGATQTEILEVKPLKESLQEKAKTARDKMALAVNMAKWKAADEFAKRNGMKFRVVTEQSLFRQAPKKPRAPKTTKKTVGTRK